jgi:hypothetical protein
VVTSTLLGTQQQQPPTILGRQQKPIMIDTRQIHHINNKVVIHPKTGLKC